MGLANGLYLHLPSREVFAYPAGDKILCQVAIGWVKKDGGGLVCSSCEKTEVPVGFVKKATRASGDELESGTWTITNIRSVKFSGREHGDIESLRVDVRGPRNQIRGVILQASHLSVMDLFQK